MSFHEPILNIDNMYIPLPIRSMLQRVREKMLLHMLFHNLPQLLWMLTRIFQEQQRSRIKFPHVPFLLSVRHHPITIHNWHNLTFYKQKRTIKYHVYMVWGSSGHYYSHTAPPASCALTNTRPLSSISLHARLTVDITAGGGQSKAGRRHPS